MSGFRVRLPTLLGLVAIFAVGLGLYDQYVLRKPDYKVLVIGGSRAMAPTLTTEILAADMNAYRRAIPERWQVVVLRPREQPNGAYIGELLRVIGLPGETVSFSDGKVIINGRPLDPPQRLQRIRSHSDRPDVKSVGQPYTVPAGCYYLLGDNPDEANDSRLVGAFPEAEIRGRVSGR